MSAEKTLSNEYSNPARIMGSRVESMRVSRQQPWTTSVKEKFFSHQGHKSSKFQDTCTISAPLGKAHADLQQNGMKQHADERQKVQVHPSTTGQKHQLSSKTKKDDELVKYMSNLPDYLQQAEKQKNVQVKALNFGVLDWKRLEKWKDGEHMPGRSRSKASSSGSSLYMESGKSALFQSSGGRKTSTDLQLKFSTEVRYSEDAKLTKGPQTVSQSKVSEQQKDFSMSVRSSTRNCPPAKHDKGKKKEADHIENTSLMSSVTLGKQHGKSRTAPDSNINAEPQNIVLLKPKGPSHRSSSHVSRSSASSDGHLAKDAKHRYSALSSSQEPRSRDFSHDIPHSCPLPPHRREKSTKPLPSDAKPKANPSHVDYPASADTSKEMNIDATLNPESRESSRRQVADRNRSRYRDFVSSQELHCRVLKSEIPHSCPLLDNVALSQGRESDYSSYPIPNDASLEPRLSNATCPESKSCNLDDSVSIESFNEMDLALGKQTSRRGRHPSPHRRFSFSFSRLSRSFSFKESSTSADVMSTHSENYELSAAIGDSSRDKVNASGRRRPSPFRRLIDPIWKPILSHHSTEAVQNKHATQSPEENFSFAMLHPNDIDKPLPSGTNQALGVEALMQLTVKNGVPFFKFVVDNRSDILAAALKQLPSAGKGDCSLTYSFYSVHEIKKKAGGWITHGSKSKNGGFGYNVVGQMKLSRSYISELNAVDCHEHDVVTESVLYDVNSADGDKGLLDFSPNREIAAIIQKDLVEELKDTAKNMTVILPGATHTLPSNSAPSSLIQRWKSGGLCDCGGWDVGCKLKILTDGYHGSSFSPEHVTLFIQGGNMRDQPIFSLVPVEDGMYSVEFNSSISLLEAFSICVAVLTNRKFAYIFDIKHMAESNLAVESNSGNDDEKKNEIRLQGELPAKFAAFPPSSPVGRI
ncbi:OLC1v1034976C3 [Oldenlandia corymbosa var. corymbosa]|nr:OLC1v1034976C3 [Oldenlandia corymbosa var. corymbosa]